MLVWKWNGLWFGWTIRLTLAICFPSFLTDCEDRLSIIRLYCENGQWLHDSLSRYFFLSGDQFSSATSEDNEVRYSVNKSRAKFSLKLTIKNLLWLRGQVDGYYLSNPDRNTQMRTNKTTVRNLIITNFSMQSRDKLSSTDKLKLGNSNVRLRSIGQFF